MERAIHDTLREVITITVQLGQVGDTVRVAQLTERDWLRDRKAVRDLRVYAESLDGKVCHYPDKNNLECDAVVHLLNGSYGLI